MADHCGQSDCVGLLNMTQNQDIHVWLSSKVSAGASWVAAMMGIGSALGWVNLTVGVLSALWLMVQLWNWWAYVRPMAKARLADLHVAAARNTSDNSVSKEL